MKKIYKKYGVKVEELNWIEKKNWTKLFPSPFFFFFSILKFKQQVVKKIKALKKRIILL